MTIESAKLILEGAGILDHPLRYEAKGYLAGHASRDPEVADLKADLQLRNSQIKSLREQFENDKKMIRDDRDEFIARGLKAEKELSAERETVEKLKVDVKMWSAARLETLQELADEREASRKLVEAATHLSEHYRIVHGPMVHMGAGPMLFKLLAEALKFYATPGHSPEGKTL